MRWFGVTGIMVALLAILTLSTAMAAEQRTFTIQEPFGIDWGPERVTYSVDFPQGAVRPNSVALADEAGQPCSVQLTDVQLWPDGKSVKSAVAAFMVTLTPNQKKTWTLTAGKAAARAVAGDLNVTVANGIIQVETSKTGVRLAGGKATYAPAVDGDKVPGPLQGVRLPGKQWVGKGWWQTDVKCTGYTAELTDNGPVFARVKLHYDFEGGKYYQAIVELNAGQDLAVVSEEYNLSEGKRYAMSGMPGMKADVKYGYVSPKFASPDKALIWDWWGQTMAVLPTPNQYCFSFGKDLHPDSAIFEGRSQYGNLRPGDGGLKYDKDGRFAYINSYLQWGDEETLYLGLYNSKNPTSMLGVIGLRPSQWVHPDIDPHPNATLQQYVQTTCLTFERRTDGDVFFRAPACLGKRVYGIGGIERSTGKHLIPTRGGPVPSDPNLLGDDLMLRHVRLGRLALNTVKDWVLDYDETSKYPRLFVPEGDRDLYLKRMRDAGVPPPNDTKCVTDALNMSSHLVLHFAQCEKNLMDYGLDEGPIADMAEAALSSPACTPAQAKELRKWLAAIAYYSLDQDFVPPRSAGFAWGSANMEPQVQCRACRIAALLPHHPAGKEWRAQLAKLVTLYVEDQVNEAGAPLECPHYGTMEVEMPIFGLVALANCGDVDLSRVAKRLKAAAHMRLGTLLPWDTRGDFRSTCAEGDGYYMPDEVFAPLAGFFAKTDPAMTKNLMWGFNESGRDMGKGATDQSYTIFDPGMPAEQPKLGTEYFPGYGFVMRNGFPSHDEAYLQVYADGHSWGHGHTDRGSWVLYAKGAPLMMDFAAMYTPSMRELWLHPGGLTFNHDETVRPAGNDPKDDWWRKCSDAELRNQAMAPFTDVEPKPDPDSTQELDAFGKVTAFKSTPQADYAEMQRHMRYFNRVPYVLQANPDKNIFDDGVFQELYLKNPFTWTRRFVFVKDADLMGHNYLVIRDDLPGNNELDPYLNLWCLASKVDVQGQTAIYTGLYGVDVHCYVAEPATYTPKTRTVSNPRHNLFGFGPHFNATFKDKPFEDQIQLQIPQAKKDGGYFVVMVPVKQGEAAPKFETLAGGKAVRVTFPDRVDTIVLQPAGSTAQVDGQTITATSVLLVKRGDKQDIIDLTGK